VDRVRWWWLRHQQRQFREPLPCWWRADASGSAEAAAWAGSELPNGRSQRHTILDALGVGARYDLSDNYHLLAYVNRGVQNADATDQLSWYTALLFTF
jgi:hypothetical protein